MKQKLELQTQWGTTEQVTLEINQYLNNECIYIGLTSYEDDYPEPYGDLTVNLGVDVPDYCGFVDMNNMPGIETFIKNHNLGSFTGIRKESGFVFYPLYEFNADRLRELCPEDMEKYEQEIRKRKEEMQKKEEQNKDGEAKDEMPSDLSVKKRKVR